MSQVVVTSSLLVASPQQGGGLSDAIKNLVNGTLQEARNELTSQLAEMTSRRAELQGELAQAGSRVERARLQSRIDRLDTDIRELNQAIAKLGSGVTQTPPPPTFPEVGRAPNFSQPRIDPVPIIGTTLGILFVAFPLALTISRYIWKRSTSAPSTALNQEQTRRFDRLEQSVDAIAIEIERISENQRYLTKLLAEPKQAEKIGS